MIVASGRGFSWFFTEMSRFILGKLVEE